MVAASSYTLPKGANPGHRMLYDFHVSMHVGEETSGKCDVSGLQAFEKQPLIEGSSPLAFTELLLFHWLRFPSMRSCRTRLEFAGIAAFLSDEASGVRCRMHISGGSRYRPTPTSNKAFVSQ